MRGEDRSHVELARGRLDVGVAHLTLRESALDERGDSREGPVVSVTTLSTAVCLFGDVGQMEVHRKRTYELARGGEVESLE